MRDALRTRPQVELTGVIADRPLEQGLAELVTYLSLTDAAFEVLFDEDHREEVRWLDTDGVGRRASIPRVVFTRSAEVGRSLAATEIQRNQTPADRVTKASPLLFSFRRQSRT